MRTKAGYIPSHPMHLRIRPTVFAWIREKAEEEQIAVSTYVNKRLSELADLDLRKGEDDGPRAA